jgi:hypothetical protein
VNDLYPTLPLEMETTIEQCVIDKNARKQLSQAVIDVYFTLALEKSTKFIHRSEL